MDDDRELLRLFATEAQEHLQTFDERLLRLEREPQDAEALREAFRSVHSLKGAAGLVGLPSVALAAHGVEDVIGAAREGRLQVTSTVVDELCRAADVLRTLVQEGLTGELAEVDVQQLQAGLRALLDSPEPAATAVPRSVSTAQPQAVETGQTRTLRVEAEKLDRLQAEMGNLLVTRSRSREVQVELELLSDAWQQLRNERRRYLAQRAQLRGLAARLPPSQARRLLPLLDGLDRTARRAQVFEQSLRRTRAEAREVHEELGRSVERLEEDVRQVRLLPLSKLFEPLPRLVRDLSRELGRPAELALEGSDIAVDKRIVEELRDPLVHLVRNAFAHGLEGADERRRSGKSVPAEVRVAAFKTATGLVLEVWDDGRGLDPEQLRRVALEQGLFSARELEGMSPSELQAVVFVSGFSSARMVSDLCGRGVGLDVVAARCKRLGGTVTVESEPRWGTVFRLSLPLKVSTVRVMLVSSGAQVFALGTRRVRTTCLVRPDQVFRAQSRDTMMLDAGPVHLVCLSRILGLDGQAAPEGPCLVLDSSPRRLGLVVDQILDERELVFRPPGPLLHQTPIVSGVCLLGSGRICVALDYDELVSRAAQLSLRAASEDSNVASASGRPHRVLLAEDSSTTRVQEQRILESEGYQVVAVTDGQAAWARLQSEEFDAVVTDVEMPGLDGFELTRRIRSDPRLAGLPVLLVTSLTSERDRQKGLEVGADAYLTKPTFSQRVLLDLLGRLL